MRKKILSIVLAVMLVLTLMPAAVFADGSAGGPVAKIGDQGYETLQAAVDAAKSGDTIVIQDKITLAERVDISASGKSISINLNGKQISSADTCANGSVFNVVSGTVTIYNGILVGIEGLTGLPAPYTQECDVITARNGSVVNLSDVNISVNSATGACVYAFNGGKINIYSGTYTNSAEESDASGVKDMLINQEDNKPQAIFVYGGTFYGLDPNEGDNSKNPTTFLANNDYYSMSVEDYDAGTKYCCVSANNSIAKIGDNKYASLADAIDAVPLYKTSPTAIQMACNVTNATGISVPSGKNFIIDFNNHTYTCVSDPAGSTGTKNQVLQLLKGSTITMKNGTVNVAESAKDQFRFIIQNYCDLTLNNMKIDGTNLNITGKNSTYAISNNYGDTKFIDTEITASNATSKTNVAFDCYYYGNDTYPSVSVEVTNSTINGAIEYAQASSPKYTANFEGHKHKIIINSGTFSDLSGIQYCTDGAVYKLGANVVLNAGVDVTGTVELDLNGKTITPADSYTPDYLIAVLHGGSLTLKDSLGGGSVGTAEKNAMVGIKMTKKADIADDLVDTNPAVLTVKSGAVYGEEYGISGNGTKESGNMRNNTAVTIEGGTIKATTTAAVSGNIDSIGIYNPQDGTLTINGGTIEGNIGVYVKSGHAVTSVSGTAQIKGTGVVNEYAANGNGGAKTGDAFVVENADYPGGTPTVSIASGTFTSTNGKAVASYAKEGKTALTGFITGGTFSTNPSAYVASGYAVKDNGNDTFTVYYPTPSGGGGGGSTTPKDIVSKETSGDVSVVPEVTAKNGEATATITEQNVDKAIEYAKETKTDLIVIEPEVKGSADKVEVVLPTSGVKEIVSNTNATVDVETKVAAVSIPNDTLAEIAKAATGSDISINVEKADAEKLADKLPTGTETKNALTVDVTITSNGKEITTFGGKALNVKIPVDTKKFVNGKSYVVYIISSDGSVEQTTAIVVNGVAVVKMTHFSKVVIVNDEAAAAVFVDVKPGDYYYNAVTWAVANGITSGVDATHFNPKGYATRAQMVAFLWRAAGCPEPTATSCNFTDVKPAAYYYKAVLWAVENGITGGTTATTFSPNQTINRGQAVTFLARMSGVKDDAAGYTHNFTDVNANSFCNNAVAWAATNNITSGKTATTFGPKDNCLRGQLVTFLYNYFVK